MRIQRAQLNLVVERLNKLLGVPTEPWIESRLGRHSSNVGCFHIENENGVYKLSQMTNTAGITRPVLRGGTKTDLYRQVHDLIRGVEFGLDSCASVHDSLFKAVERYLTEHDPSSYPAPGRAAILAAIRMIKHGNLQGGKHGT